MNNESKRIHFLLWINMNHTTQNITGQRKLCIAKAFRFHLKYIFITKLFQTHQRKQNVIFDGWKNGAIIIKVKVLWVETPQWETSCYYELQTNTGIHHSHTEFILTSGKYENLENAKQEKTLRLMENYLKESEMSKSTKTSKTCVTLRYLLLEAREQEIKEKRA